MHAAFGLIEQVHVVETALLFLLAPLAALSFRLLPADERARYACVNIRVIIQITVISVVQQWYAYLSKDYTIIVMDCACVNVQIMDMHAVYYI